ncbi:MAG: GNAT family N-acetyltransferase [Acidobacteriia bacterium]|nr:GNAT family N-acetyltransferase [Terriglobia bacterium]
MALQRLSELTALDREVRNRLGTAYSHESWGESQFLLELPEKWELSRVVLDENAVCGFLIASRKGDLMHIHRFAVAEAQRSSGLGRRLLDELAGGGNERHAAGITLSVAAGNDRAVSFYERAAFSVVEQITVAGHPYYRMIRHLSTQPVRSKA